MFAELPVGIEDPVERLHAIRAQMDGLKESKQAVAGEALTSPDGLRPAHAAGPRHPGRHPGARSATSTRSPPTCPGRRSRCTPAGARCCGPSRTSRWPRRVRVGVAIFSYDGELNFGITGDYDTASDIDVLADGIGAGVKELLTA